MTPLLLAASFIAFATAVTSEAFGSREHRGWLVWLAVAAVCAAAAGWGAL